MRALGLMSGTSMDGVDAAVLETDGETIAGFGPSGFAAYGAEERALLRAALGRWPGEPGLDGGRGAGPRRRMRRRCAGSTGVEVVGFHGQTLAHEPRGRGTHQIGRGDWLARDCGLPVVWDFRTADVASGGEGAPLVPFFHFACARWIGAEAPVAFLNLGGRRQRDLGRSAGGCARGAGGAGGVRHRAGERADRRFPGAQARRGLRRGRRGGGGGAGAGRGARRAGRASVPGAAAAEVLGPAGFSRVPRAGGERSRPRTGRRRWRR